MAYYEDLGTCDYFGTVKTPLRAVGWLAAERTYVSGQVALDFFYVLMQLLGNPWQPLTLAGRHQCEFCRFTGGPSRVVTDDATVAVGTANLFVPDRDVVFVAPSLIVHYIDAHGYMPPEVFQKAVMTCPPMRSMGYLKAIRLHGVHEIATRAQGRQELS